jgi:serine/threonine protein kinase
MTKCNFELYNITTPNLEDPINSTLIIDLEYNNITYGYKICSHLGQGTVGDVYLLDFLGKNNYVIKISKRKTKNDLISEINIFQNYLIKNENNQKIFPIFYGKFKDSNRIGIVYNYLGNYNLEKFKLNHYNLFSFNNNIDMIKQIIEQLISFDDLIHCDLKASNIIIDIKDNRLISTITDLGLSNLVIPDKTVLSTNYITSPESLLTVVEYRKCLVYNKDYNIKKHDHFGIFVFILNLFLIKNYWNILNNYLTTELKIDSEFLIKQESSVFYVYIWYKFNNSYSNNQSLQNVIYEIEKIHPQLLNMNFINFDLYFKLYILPNLNLNLINKDKTIELYSFLKLLIKFDPDDRPTLEELFNHKFLN